ncbi:MAG: hypothetical protein H0U75_12370 [Legionella sp.]|nr:hypothetical protein [Legionella sp.]
MAIKDDRLKQFFSVQKVGSFEALKSIGKGDAKKKSTLTNQIENKVSTQNNLLKEVLPSKYELQKEKHLEILPLTKVITNPIPNSYQSVTEPLATSDHMVSNPLSMSEQLVSNSLQTTLANFDVNQFTDLRLFSKKECYLINIIFEHCHNNGSLITPPIETEEIRNALNVSPERVRNLIFRIVKKGGVKVLQYKSGQNAYRVFELPKSLYQAMIDVQHKQKRNLANQALAEPLASSLYSSSSLNITTTTDLTDEWKKIDLTPLKQINFGLIELKNIFKKCASLFRPEQIQDSINKFSFGITNNPTRYKGMKSPSAVLVNHLCQGVLWEEDSYISQEEIDRVNKESQRREFLIKQFKQPKFIEWLNGLNNIEKEELVPEVIRKGTSYMIAKDVLQKEHATLYFENVIWPKLITEIELAL